MIEATPDQVADAFGLGTQEPRPSYAGLARLCRIAIARWKGCTRRQLNQWILELTESAGKDVEQTKIQLDEVMSRLLACGDVLQLGSTRLNRELSESGTETATTSETADEGAGAAQRLLFPGTLRLVRFGAQVLICGSRPAEQPLPSQPFAPTEAASSLRWLRFNEDRSQLEALIQEDAHWIEPEEWLGYPEYLEHIKRRRLPLGDEPGSSFAEVSNPSASSLGELWYTLKSGLRLSATDQLGSQSILVGEPGQFFGSPSQRTGRWTKILKHHSGIFFSAGPGFGKQQVPSLLCLEGGSQVSQVTLFSRDEFCWGLLARGICEGSQEVVTMDGPFLKFSCWLPAQLQRIQLLGSNTQGWTYRFPAGTAPRLAQLLQDFAGLRLTSNAED